jgi:uncharacterized protein YodC (DUF2158 family)
MSWYVVLFKYARRLGDLSELAVGERPLSLGSVERVQSAVASAFPGVVWSDTASGNFSATVGSVDFEIKTRESVESLELHVCADDKVMESILSLRESLECQAYDGSTDTFLEQSDQPELGLHKSRAYADRFLTDPDSLREGDVVSCLEGGQLMTVARWTPAICRAVWFDEDNQLRGEDFRPDALICVTRAEGQDAGELSEALGTRVRLASGSNHLTITGWGPATAQVEWLGSQGLSRADLPIGALVQVNSL